MRVRMAVVGMGSMGMNRLRVLKDFDEKATCPALDCERSHGRCFYG